MGIFISVISIYSITISINIFLNSIFLIFLGLTGVINIICGLLRAVSELRELIRKVPKSEVLDAKEELMNSVEDKKRWLKFTKKIQ